MVTRLTTVFIRKPLILSGKALTTGVKSAERIEHRASRPEETVEESHLTGDRGTDSHCRE
jgi:hypothetical protein